MENTKAQHTPGDWIAKPANLNPKDPMFYKADVICGGMRIAVVAGIGEESANANTRLIAAAPELLEACKRALIMVQTEFGTEYGKWLVDVIAKAEGQ